MRTIKTVSLVMLAVVFMNSLVMGQKPGGAGATITGTVIDANGDSVTGARVKIRRGGYGDEREVITDEKGEYRITGVSVGSYLLTAESVGFNSGTVVINVAGSAMTGDIRLGTTGLSEEVTVTTTRGVAESASKVPESVSIIGDREIGTRRAVILPQLLEGEPGVAVQQTTAGQGSPYIRGLTGQQVVNLLDGIRYNTSTFRPGPNQYTALIEPATVGRIEIVRGPNGTQFGSDSFGGTINMLTQHPGIGRNRQWMGGVDTNFGSADLSSGGSAFLSGASERTSFIFGGAGRQMQDIRPGGGRDSRAAVLRYLGIDSNVLGSRLQDTKFQQYAGWGKFLWTPTSSSLITVNFNHGQQRGVRRYDQLNGGNGNLINDFNPQILNFFYLRYQKEDLSFFDSISAIFSVNSQRDDRRFQGGLGNPEATITAEYNRTDALGYTFQGNTHIGSRHQIILGAELYDEYVTSRRNEYRPTDGSTNSVRARYPDGARYNSLGLFIQDRMDVIPNRLSILGGIRYSRFDYRQLASKNPFTVNGVESVPDTSINFDDFTFNLGAVLRATDWLVLNANVNRGFRAPNVSDFGSIGLTSLGFEITPQSANAAGAQFQDLTPETIYSYEFGAKVQNRRFDAGFKYFNSDIKGLIQREDLVLQPGVVGSSVGGQLITGQNASGRVFTALSTRPIQVRQNINRVRLQGMEASLRGRVSPSLLLSGNTAYVRNNISGSDKPAEFEGFTPPWISHISLLWEPPGKRFWVETYSILAYKQARYSEEDLEEQRTGAARSRNDIRAFFNNGAVARGLVQPDPSGIARLVSSGETLAQVQNRLLPIGATINGVTVADDSTDVPLYTSTAGFATLNLRLGYRLAEGQTLTLSIENLLDRNYRINGSGIDAPGVNATLRYSYRF